jgi:hypothetical protein
MDIKSDLYNPACISSACLWEQICAKGFHLHRFLWPILDRPVQNMNLNKNYTLQG